MTQTVGESADARQQPARASGPPHDRSSHSPPTSRVIRIIELLASPEQPPLPLADIVRRTGLSRATAHAIVGELVDHGWVLRDGKTGAYTVGPAFAALARATGSADNVARWASTCARELSERFDMPAFVAQRIGSDLITVTDHVVPARVRDRDDSPWFRHGRQVRLRPPICREFIAYESVESQAAWIAQAPDTIRARLRTVLDAVSERGYSIERMTDDHVAMIEALGTLDSVSDRLRARVGDLLTELSAIDYLPAELEGHVAAVTIGAPIFDSSGLVVASIVVCPNTTLPAADLRHLAEQTRAAASSISTRLR
ncbi:helix-turn-helix domain-containing protein [Gordonia sp. LSe1-13]|uniref:Helix-turn-helix domain-containing protein n=1 Tax=Gordonia sesuvii TaxID=3116777 RepID=A0ABU7M8V2_9ACTN|nr:helix-turn-helix domain-containing protein [Gordonia sp. LSe1-13]